MIRSSIKFALIIPALLTFFSCEKEGLFNPGNTTSREVQLSSSINSIEVKAMFNITLVQDTTNKVIITCGENLQDNIDIYTKDSKLYLESSIKYNWSRKYNKIDLELHLTNIPTINVRKPVYITTCDTFKTNQFYLIDWEQFTELNVTLDVNNCIIDVSSDNFGHYTLKGRATSATLNCWGSAFIYAENMKVNKCNVIQKSIGDVHVSVLDELNVSFKSTGKVYYYGNPSTIIVDTPISNSNLIHITKQ